MGKSKHSRINAMAAANAAMDIKRLGDSVKEVADIASGGDGTIAKISLTVGSSKSESETWTEDSVASGSSVQAGGNVNIMATGAGEDSNIIIEGSYVGGGKSTNLTADNDINIIAAESTSSEASKNSSSGWNAGVVASIGSGGTGFGITAGANKGKGRGDGDDLYYTNSIVGTETGQTTIISGGNTNIMGGEVYGKGGELNVGGDLTIVSLQDQSTYHLLIHSFSKTSKALSAFSSVVAW